MDVAALIAASRQLLTPAERRVADVVLSSPQEVAFGTVADLARRAGTSGATVVRLAAKLGLDGFTALQEEVQAELAHRLRPAAERIREPQPGDVIGRAALTELDNVQGTLEGVSRDEFDHVVGLLADPERRVAVLPGEASRGVGLLLADELSMLRPGVQLLLGTEVRLAQAVAEVEPGDVVVVIDLRRYERWLLSTVALLGERGARIVALSDSALSPLADLAHHTFVVLAEGSGPFDSHVGTLALANALTSGVAGVLQATATERLDRIEAVWRATDALADG